MTRDKLSTATSRGWQGRPRRSPRYGIVISIVSLALLVVVALMFSRSAPQVTKITTASALDDAFEPVDATDTFKPTETFFVSVKILNYQSGQDIRARWRFNGDTVGETSLETHGAVGDITAGFSLSSQQRWPEGRYTVDIMYGDTVLSSAEFRVGS